ncbi:MAG: ABC transporter ATP-binding protein [Euzebya sp.]
MSFSHYMSGGRPMMPGTSRVRRGQDGDRSIGLRSGLIGRVWRTFAKPYRGRLILLIVLIAMASSITVIPARLIGLIVDALNATSAQVDPLSLDAARGQVTWLALGLIGIAVTAGLLSIVQRYYSSFIGEQLIHDLRRALFDHVQRMPLAFFTRTQTGALISRLNNDVVGAQSALTGTFGTLAANIVQVLATVGLMLTINWQLTLLTLVVLPFFVLAAKGVGRKLQGLTRESMELNADMNTFMTERFNVAGALVVKLFGRPTEETDTFGRSALRVADIGVQTAVVGRVFFVVLSLMGALGTAAVYLVGGRLALSGDLSIGDVVTFGTLVTQAYSPLAALSNAPVEILTALVSFDRVFEILDIQHPIADAADAVPLMNPTGRVEFSDVTFAYPTAHESTVQSLDSWADVMDTRMGEPVLHGVSFVAEPGQTVALVGPSGAGKSTILSLVSRLYDVDSGVVSIDGHDVRDLTLASLNASIGVVSQDPHLFHSSIGDNLRFAKPTATDEQIRDACIAAQIHDVIAGLPDGYDTVVGDRGYRLSGGEKQRVAIARVLLKNPSIIVLDEATSHLDSDNEERIQQALMVALQGRTSLVIAHRLSTIVGADQILVIEDGRVTQQGTHSELVGAAGRYGQLYATQFGTVPG